MSAYSLDLREKIVESVKKGVPKAETARRFGVDRATVKRYCKQLDERGTLEPRKAPGKKPKRDEFLRSLWRMEVGRIDPGQLVFVDEMGTHTSLAPVYAYAPIGQRAFLKIPRNRGKNTTLLTSLHQEGMGPSLAVEGATTSRVFETHVERLLAPTLRPGQVVVMDNLGAHRPRRVRELIEERDCELIYLPPYSPDLRRQHLLCRLRVVGRGVSAAYVSPGWAGTTVVQKRRGVWVGFCSRD